MRLALLLALCLAAPLAAQTPDPNPPESYYPLDVGDIREYRGGFPLSYYRESVVGDTIVGGQMYRIVEARAFNYVGVEVYPPTRHAIRFDSARAVPVESNRFGPEIDLVPCRLDLPLPPLGEVVNCGFASMYVELDREVVVGGDTLTVDVKHFDGLFGERSYASGLGLIYFLPDATDYDYALTFARVGGVRYGAPSPRLPPLAPEPSAYWPLEVGNVWVHRDIGEYPHLMWWTVTGTTSVSDTSYALVERCVRVLPVGTTTCAAEPTRVDNRTGEILVRDGGTERAVMCGLLPTATSGPAGCDPFNLSIEGTLSVLGPGDVQIGTAMVPTPSIRAFEITDLAVRFAAGVGPLPAAGLGLFGVFEYARIGSVEYGVNPVSTPGAPPNTSLRIAAYPSPTTGPLAVRIEHSGPVTVEVFDALGRRVHGAQVVVAGTAEIEIDAARWSSGLYLVKVAPTDGPPVTAVVIRR